MFSHLGHVMTLANSIIGVGILAMPFCFQKCGIILAILLLIMSNWMTRICCHYLIKSSLLTRRKSFEFMGFHAFGSSGKLLVELCTIGYLLGTCITYFVVVGDVGPQIIVKMLSLEGSYMHLRTWLMIGVTLICVLPLGMLKNVDSLATVSAASIGFYICLVIKIVLESERHIIANDWSETVKYWEPAGVLQCVPIFSMALSCQMQIFEVFGSINNQSLEKLNGIVKGSVWICTSVYIAVGFFGYVAFCTQTFSGNILLNFSNSFGSDVIKIGFVLSIAFSFPLIIFPCRASIYSLLYRRGHTDVTGYIPESRFKGITIFIVSLSLCIALLIPSVELVIGLVGSTIGVAICVIFPAACYRQIVRKETMERSLAQFIVVSGFCLMILGTYANLNAIDEKRSGPQNDLNLVVDSLLRPTAIPAEEVLKLVKKQFVPENLSQSNDAAKLPENIIKKAEELKRPIQQEQNVEKPERIQNESAPPALPIDEEHKNEKVIKEKLKNVNDVVEKAEENLTDKKKAAPVVNTIVEDESLKKKSIKSQEKGDVVLENAINKDAIKKDEEIAAEETKNEKNVDKASENDELKKTQNELKKTKELLERTVDELKEELAKQNKETQELVVEKLGEVVEKVEQIQKKVEQADPQAMNNKVDQQNNQDKLKDSLKTKNMDSIVGILSASANNAAKKAKSMETKAQDTEPLSYKIGEKLESLQNGTDLNRRLRLPLPLLINATLNGKNETLMDEMNLKEKLHQKNKTSTKNNGIQTNIAEDPPTNDINSKMNLAENVAEKEPIDNNLNKDKDIEKVEEKENVEAIRREILEFDSKQDDSITTNAALKHERIKRSDEESKKDCLSDNKIESMILLGVSGAIESKMQSISRKLKALDEKEGT